MGTPLGRGAHYLRGSYVVHRLAQTVVVLFGVTVIIFLLIHLVPGDPAITMLGSRATPDLVAQLHSQWGLDKPLISQYGFFIGRLIHGDLGTSLVYAVPVRGLIVDRIGVTLILVGFAALLAVLLTVPLATLAATKKGSVFDHAVRVVPLVGLGMPSFWLGILLLIVFAVKVQWFPVGGYGGGLIEDFRSLVLPALTLALALTPILVRSLRESMIGVLESGYVATARSKGLPERRVVLRHVLRNSILPALTLLSVNLGFLLGGTLIVEKVFALPGLGSLLLDSIANRDFPVVQAVVVVISLLVVLVNLATDLLYRILDPRVTLE